MNLADVGRSNECIGTISYMAVRPTLRRKGHGQKLVSLLERDINQIARDQGWHLHIIVLESESRATEFWSICDYLWPNHSRYAQPSFESNYSSEKSVPETLMVRMLGLSSKRSIERSLLLDVAKMIYMRWYAPRSGSPQEISEGQEVIDTLYEDFKASLIEGDMISLVRP